MDQELEQDQEWDQEQEQERINHDEAFKKLLHTFSKEFIELFFPRLAKELDLGEVIFLSEEQLHDIVGGQSRRLDVLFRARLRGQEVHILVHLEPQSWHEADFHERMYIYFGRLYEKYRKQYKLIIPIAVFSGPRKKKERNGIDMRIAGYKILQFRFLKVQLKRSHWRQFIDSDNPVAAALLAKRDYNEEERRELRKAYLRMLLRLRQKLDDARLALVMSVADLYYKSTVEEDQSIAEELNEQDSKEGHELMKLMPEWSKQAYMEGKEEGREEGKELIIRNLLRKDFSLEQIADMVDEPIEKIRRLAK
ncbi:hypothetical protein B1748_30625 [Paenibacillus sp. MY03]|uniref:Rpn family recombination-promoting nuclease/putative transposase n=1 Tax=Paenibacillus sp. MY03 TaxID=302980 RepID=UPI000B3CBA35|nr:Rpn family recombination-promoting nuclease/putative transposase [Paenibacillus sp. MY03]OUS69697.1 hypothetical protein B1748_30625 [Paenibacillus sp. MY03]